MTPFRLTFFPAADSAARALLLIGRAGLQDEMTTKIERARALGESI